MPQAAADKQKPTGKDTPPIVDLVQHHSICEINYHRLLKIMPGIREYRDNWQVLMGVERNIHVSISVLDLAPYTTLVEVRQKLAGISCSTIQVRLYHDVEMAEIVEWDRHKNWRSHYDYPNQKMYHPDEKLAINRYLNDWLLFCSREGNAGRFLCDLVLVNKK